MSSSLIIESQIFNQQLVELKRALHANGQHSDAQNILKDESRRFTQEMIKLTPPKNQAQGRKAVSRDFRRANRPLKAEDWTNKTIADAIRKKDVVALNSIWLKIPKLRNRTVMNFHPGIHLSARKSRGRVHGDQKIDVLPHKEWRRRLTELLSRVGRSKSGWMYAAIALGVKVTDIPKYILRNYGKAKGGVRIVTSDKSGPSITVWNNTIPDKDTGRRGAWVLRKRMRKVESRIKLVIRNYGKQMETGRNVRPVVQIPQVDHARA